MATKQITLDVWQCANTRVYAVQGEADARFLSVTLVSNGAPVDLTGKTVYLYMIKPDGNEIFNTCTVEDAAGGKVMAALTAQMSAAAGDAKDVEFRVVGGDQDTDTLKIKGPALRLLPSDYDGAIASTPEYTALTDALASVNDFDAVKALAEAAIPSSEKGANGGVATLDGSGKLVQKPTPAEIGAVPTSALNQSVATIDSNGDLNQMPNAHQVGAIPSGEKGAKNGVATLNASGKLVQMPGPADLGIGDYVVETGSNSNGRYVKYNSGRMVCDQRKTIGTASWTAENDFQYASVSWTFPAAFTDLPQVYTAVQSNGHVWTAPAGPSYTFADIWMITFYGTAPRGMVLNGYAVGRWK